MKKPNCRHWLILFYVFLGLTTGCTYIKSLFPDKERDYQFRSEIPELIIPDDLKPQAPVNNKYPLAAIKPPASDTAANKPKPVVETKPKSTTTATTTVKTIEPSPKPQETKEASAIQVEVSQAAVSSIQIDQPIVQAWRMVSRALNKQQIEIVERNADNNYYFVKYDPDAKKLEDKSFWNEIDFLFGNDPSNEKKYRISLFELSAQLTEVTIQNEIGQTISDLPATRLLKLITDGINQEPNAETTNP